MQRRLMRSRTDRMIAGVCGGVAEYVDVDPVLVRLIFVLFTLTTGIGLLLYPIMWMLMPKSGLSEAEQFPHDPEEWRRRVESVGREAAEFGQSVERGMREAFGDRPRGGGAPTTYASPPPEASFRFDPYTGEPLAHQVPPSARPPQQNRSRWGGMALVALGVIFTAQYFGVPTDILIPGLMIIAGIVLLVRR